MLSGPLESITPALPCMGVVATERVWDSHVCHLGVMYSTRIDENEQGIESGEGAQEQFMKLQVQENTNHIVNFFTWLCNP